MDTSTSIFQKNLLSPFSWNKTITLVYLFILYILVAPFEPLLKGFQSSLSFMYFKFMYLLQDRLCGLVVRVPGCRSRDPVRFPELPDFLRSSGSGTGFTQPREYNRGATWKKKYRRLENREYGRRDLSR
jgi:hypothetical protein